MDGFSVFLGIILAIFLIAVMLAGAGLENATHRDNLKNYGQTKIGNIYVVEKGK